MTGILLGPARWLADRAWYALARRIMPLDDSLVDVGGAAGFDGHAIGERLDRDIVPTPARLGAVGVPRRLDERPYGVGR